MKNSLYKMVVAAVALLASIPSAHAVNALNGNVNAPDGGASIVLLAIGCSGLAIAARKRFKR